MTASEWMPIRLGGICTKIGSGATPRGGSDVYLPSGPYALVRSQNVHNDGFYRDGLAFIGEKHAAELENVEVLKGDVLLNLTGDSVARACQVDQRVLPARVNQHVAIIRPDPDKLDPRFLRYFLVSPEMQTKLLSWAGSGGTRNALTKGMIESFDVLAPKDVGEQRAIAHILGTLDDKIELNRRMHETLEAMARALFKSWFVDFEPVRAKAEGRDPGLPKALADLFPDSFEGSKSGETPRGWDTPAAGSLLSLDKGLSYKGEFLADSGVPMVTLGCFLGQGRFNQRACKYYTGEFQSRHTVKPGDLLLANTDITQRREVLGSPGIVAPFGDADVFLFTHHVYAVRFKKAAGTWKLFVYFMLVSEEFRDRAAGFATGTTVLALPHDAVLNLPLLAPPIELIDAFNAVALPLLRRQWASEAESDTLAAFRDALLPKLISGELRVKDADRIIGHVT